MDAPDYPVIADVSETLRAVLGAGLEVFQPAAPRVVLHDLQGEIETSPPTVTLFLFEVLEDLNTRNRPRRRETVGNQVRVKKPALALLLRYLITPWSPDRLTDQKILGRITQLLYDNPILAGPDFEKQPSLENTSEAFKITMVPLTLEDRTRIWHALQKPYRLSVTYELRVVNIETEESRTAASVATRQLAPGGAEAAR